MTFNAFLYFDWFTNLNESQLKELLQTHVGKVTPGLQLLLFHSQVMF